MARNVFIITERGGLPPNPTETLSGETVLTNWAIEPQFEHSFSAEVAATNATKVTTITRIVEALLMGDRFRRRGDPHSFCVHRYIE